MSPPGSPAQTLCRLVGVGIGLGEPLVLPC